MSLPVSRMTFEVPSNLNQSGILESARVVMKTTAPMGIPVARLVPGALRAGICGVLQMGPAEPKGTWQHCSNQDLLMLEYAWRSSAWSCCAVTLVLAEGVGSPRMQGQVLGSAMLSAHLGMVTGTTGGEGNGLEIQVGSPSAGVGAAPRS